MAEPHRQQALSIRVVLFPNASPQNALITLASTRILQ